ncbi:MAG: universal stress protein [Rhizobiales bacterium]|nr:universal stress protein [Hyphomicrobiales bacterium]
MISSILVAIDGSSHSMRAADTAFELASALKAKAVLLNVAKSREIPDAMRKFAEAEQFPQQEVDLLEFLKRGAENMLSEAADKARSEGVEDIVCEVKEGPIARTIIARAEHHKANLIVIGSRGMGDIEGYLRGGVSHRVEMIAKCPVLIVK